MKIIITILMLLTILGTRLIASEDKGSSFPYACISPYTIGGGMRSQAGMHAWDVSAHLMPLFLIGGPYFDDIYGIHLKGSYLCYPKNKGFYFGGGAGVLGFSDNYFELVASYATIEGTAGYQWKTKKCRNLFVEFNLTHLLIEKSTISLPCVTFGIGF